MKELLKDKTKIIILIVSFILISYFGFSIYILGVGSVTGDDLSHSSAASDYGTFAAYDQARIAHFFNAFLVPVPYLFDSHIYYKAIQIFTNIAFIVSIGAVLSILFKNKYIWYVYSILAITLWQNSDAHNLMVSYPFYIGFSIFTFSISSIFFIYYLRLSKDIYLLFSLVTWIFTSKGTEFYMMYFPMFFFIAYFESNKNNFKEKVKDTFRNIKWHALVTFFLFIAYVIFRNSVESSYAGSKVSLDFSSFLSSLVTYSIGLAPGAQAYFNFKNYSIFEFTELIDPYIIVVSILVIYLLIILKEKIQQIDLSNKYLLLVLLYLTLAPNFLISLTTKYQYYVSYHGVNNYLYSSHSFFAIVFTIIIALTLSKKNVYYYILVVIISIFVLLTQVNNKLIGGEQTHYSEKYFLLDALLNSSYISNKGNEIKILAPTLWDEMTVVKTETEDYWTDDAWTRYAQRKVKRDIKIERYASNNDAIIEYLIGNKNESSFLTYSEENKLQAIFVSSENCNKKNPCYLLSINESLSGNVMQNTFITNDTIYKTQTLSSPNKENNYGISTYLIKSDIEDRDMTVLLEYDPMLKAQKIINFDAGFYPEENLGNDHWVWAFDNGIINIKSLKNTKVELTISIKVASKRAVTFNLNDETIKENFIDTNIKNISFIANLTKGDNQLKIVTDAQPIKLNEADDRVFSYAIFNIIINGVDSLN
ncbi:hypothetical protein [Candidatus Pseudothioglobus sp. Uisw_086]|uniref:hypothetical protein n=1 Tax=Candidatus Pseudothioglobus sp. Uisw_086 TaxID=3230998 RepID=UPI003A8AA655